MKRTSSVSRRLLALVLALGVALALAPRPAAADGAPPAVPAAPLARSIASAARALAKTAPPTRARAEATQKDSGDLAGSSRFFTTPMGIAVLTVIAVGSGYAIYSASHDRIHSPERK